ncbi:snRNA-activating protein complex subunit 1 isoform X2 [Notamacropus eugenii]|uniref:snRNA-activating protein complex subunit 1 isoform X2 n=1 Tax=Notamacropus eugenii TaxID=9315 RepID=UPI003B6839D2
MLGVGCSLTQPSGWEEGEEGARSAFYLEFTLRTWGSLSLPPAPLIQQTGTRRGATLFPVNAGCAQPTVVTNGRTRHMEKNKFSKEALALAWKYFLPPYTFQIRVGALYLMYGLYNTQLCQPKQKIRVCLKDWDEVMKFQQDLTSAQHYDASYILRKLRLDKAFHFTAMPKPLSYRMKKNNPRTEVTEEFKEPNDRVMKLITADTLEEIMNIHDHYQEMKQIISADKSQPDKALSLIKDEFLVNIKNLVLEHKQWHEDKKVSVKVKSEDDQREKEGSSQELEGSERAGALAKIKSKAYSVVTQASKSRRHRQVKLEPLESEFVKKLVKTPSNIRNKGKLDSEEETSQVKAFHRAKPGRALRDRRAQLLHFIVEQSETQRCGVTFSVPETGSKYES